jgi:hypothetical protein
MVQHQVEHIEQNKLLQRIIIDVLHSVGCNRIEDVVNKVQQLDKSITFDDIRDAVNELRRDNEITLSEPRVKSSFLGYITNLPMSISFWLPMMVTALTLATVYITPQDLPWSTVRIVVGAAFVFLMPGYLLIRLLFPAKDMDAIERIALSVGMSLAVTPLIGLLLNYSPWGTSLDPVVVSMSMVSIALASVGTYRRFLLLKENLT